MKNDIKLKKPKMNKEDKKLERLRKMYTKGKSDKIFMESKYVEIGRYTEPYTDLTKRTVGSVNKKIDVIEPVILQAGNQLVNQVMDSLFSGGRWAKMELDEEIFNQITMEIPAIQKSKYKEYQAMLDEDSKKFFKYFNNSNAIRSINTAMTPTIHLGTGCYKIIEQASIVEPFVTTSIDITELVFVEDALGRPSNVFREFEDITKDDVKLLFGKVDLERCHGETLNLIESVVRVNDGEYIHRLTDKGFNEVYYENKLVYNPFQIWRWKKAQNNVLGIGIGFELIDEFKRLKEFKELQRKSAKLTAIPPLGYSGPIEYMNKISYSMGSVSHVGVGQDMGQVSPLALGLQYQSFEEEIQKSTQLINESYISNPLGEYQDRNNVTKSEVEQRMELFRRKFSGTYEILTGELLKSTFMNIFRLLITRGMLSFPYDLIDYVNLKYNNKHSEAADQEEAQKMIQFREIGMNYYPTEVQAVMDPMFQLQSIGKLMNVPEKALYSEEVAEQNLQQQQQAQQQQQQVEQQIELTKAQ